MAIPVDNRRQSGLWQQNPSTGFYEQQAPPGPYQYYQPPARASGSSDDAPKLTFSQRAGNSSISDTFTAAIQNQVPGAGSVLDRNRARDVALATHAKIAQTLHAQVGDSKAEDFARTGHASVIHGQHTTREGQFSRDLGGKEQLRIDPNAVPDNVRAQEWSPGPDTATSPLTSQKPRQVSGGSELPVRRESIPDRSPLQKLETTMSKEEKRARVEEAEYRARQKSLGGTNGGDVARSNTLRSEKGRVVSDGSGRPSRSTSDKYYRQVSAGAPQARPPEYPTSRFTGNPITSVRDIPSYRDRTSHGPPPIMHNPQPYHHAPQQPRSLAAAHPDSGEQPRIAKLARPYHHAPEEPTSVNVADYPHNAGRSQRTSMDGGASRSVSGPRPMPGGSAAGGSRSVSGTSADAGMQRSDSGKYRHRLRDAGFAGAATAVATAGVGAGAWEAGRNDRGKAGYDNQQSQQLQEPRSPREPISPVTPTSTRDTSGAMGVGRSGSSGGVGRSGSRKLQKRKLQSEEWRTAADRRESMDRKDRASVDRSASMEQPHRTSTNGQRGKQALQTDRMGGAAEDKNGIPPASQDPDPIPRAAVQTGRNVPLNYTIPPQTANAQAAREQVQFHGESAAGAGVEQHHHHGGIFYRHGEESAGRGYVSQPPLDEWRSAKILRLTEDDIDLDKAGQDGAWWEKQQRRSSSSGAAAPAQYDGPYEEEAKSFRPPLFLKCGPLLRYTGIRKESSSSGRGEREVWRGSIMVVTEDENSDYSSVPTLRIFAQPSDLITPPSRQLIESGQEIPPEYEDPVAGQVKISRTGRPLYVRPVHDIDGGVDLSREENNQGLYAATRTPLLGPQNSMGPDGRTSPHITFQNKSRVKARDGERAGRYREVRAIRLHAERGFTFWRWSIEIELGSTQHRVAYRINRGPALGFWVPARGDTMHTMFHSCNGFSLSVDPAKFSGPDPLWRDVLNRHQARPFHVMIGGGDQVYNDAAMRDTTLFKEWLQTKNWEWKQHAEFTPEMQDELENFYMNRYSMWFSQGLFAMAGSQIPMVNLWDDHDIIDGFGSYPHHFMSTKVFTGLGAVAFKYYMLFQHQSLVAESSKEEPSWVLGASPGPYINELSRSVFLNLGRKVAFLGVDCRTERMRDEVLSQESYDILFDRARTEIRKGETKHLIVLLGVPIAYPRLNFLENILTSRAMDPIKAIGRTGMLGGFVNKFDGGVEVLDDLDDHWTAKHHKAERNWFIQELQELAAEKSVRVTILGGDVHLGAVGQFYTPKKLGLAKDRDHRYMPNVISSAIVNTPPPPMMADVLNKRNKVHHLDDETDEDLIAMFEYDVDGKKRNNKTTMPRRNYCTIREFQPGTTPPPSPPPERSVPGTPGSRQYEDEGYGREEKDRRFPPGSMLRSMSLGGRPGQLLRRLSGSGKSKNAPMSLDQQYYGDDGPGVGRSNTVGGSEPASGRQSFDGAEPPQRPINMFHRRPTMVSKKEVQRAVAKGGAPDEDGEAREPGHIDLEHGLDVCLNMEVDQQDPSGITQPYRLLIPALWYEGAPDVNTAPSRTKTKGPSFMDRFRKRGARDDVDNDYTSEDEEDQTPPPSRGQGQQMGVVGQPPARDGNMPQKPTYATYGNDGAYDPAASRSVNQPGNGYSKGYNLTPPLGSSQQAQQRANNNPYNQPGGYRRGSAPTSQKHSQQAPAPYARGQDEYSEGSLTPDDEYDNGPPRRLSKAERFFGIGDDGGRRHQAQDGGYADESYEKTKPKWKIWK